MDENFLNRLLSRIQRSLSRGRVRLTDDGGPVQQVQGKFNNQETIDNLPHLGRFGFSSNAPADSDLIAVFLNGDRGNGAVIATNHQASRPRGLAPGESVAYNQFGIRIYLSQGGLVIEAAGLPVSLNNAPTVTINAETKVSLNTAELEVSGRIKAGGDIVDNADAGGKSMAAMRETYDGHDHPVTGIQTGLGAVTSKKPNQQA